MPIANEPGRPKYKSLWPLILAVIVIAGLSIFSLWKWVESRADEGAIPREMTSQMTYEVIQSYPH